MRNDSVIPLEWYGPIIFLIGSASYAMIGLLVVILAAT